LLDQYGRTGILVLFGVLFPSLPLIGSFLLYLFKFRPKRPNPIKEDTYECGVETEGPSWIQFNARYYLIALIFVVFDIEVLFLYPWAVAFREVGIAGFIAATVFILLLAVGLVYDWKKKGLEWK
jgi:NADH-quinone oxidoreductase subunit A